MPHTCPGSGSGGAAAATLRVRFWRAGGPALVQLMRLTMFLVVDFAAGMSAVVAHHSTGIGDSAEICTDCREMCGCDLARLAYRGRPTQQLRQPGEVHRHPPRLVARQPIWSPSGATQRHLRNGGISGSARVALETMTTGTPFLQSPR
jgi:hypothetical protein